MTVSSDQDLLIRLDERVATLVVQVERLDKIMGRRVEKLENAVVILTNQSVMRKGAYLLTGTIGLFVGWVISAANSFQEFFK